MIKTLPLQSFQLYDAPEYVRFDVSVIADKIASAKAILEQDNSPSEIIYRNLDLELGDAEFADNDEFSEDGDGCEVLYIAGVAERSRVELIDVYLRVSEVCSQVVWEFEISEGMVSELFVYI